MPLRTALLRRGDTVSYRATSGKTYNVTVTGEQPATPAAPTVTNQATGGTLGIGTFSYRVSAVVKNAESQASTAGTTTTAAGATNQCTVSWGAVTGAQAYRVYGRTGGSELFIAEVPGGTTSYIDTGAITPSGALPVAGEVGGKVTGGRKVSAAKATAMRQGDRYYLR